MSKMKLSVIGVARAVPDVATFVTPVFADQLGRPVIQRIAEQRVAGFDPIALGPEYVALRGSLSVGIDDTALYGFEYPMETFSLGSAGTLVRFLAKHLEDNDDPFEDNEEIGVALHRLSTLGTEVHGVTESQELVTISVATELKSPLSPAHGQRTRPAGPTTVPRAGAVSDPRGRVVVVDDDPEFRESLGRVVRSVGDPVLFASIDDFLGSEPADSPMCIVLDVPLSGCGVRELQRDLAKANIDAPIVFISENVDIPTTVQAMRGGAIDFLTKPFRDQDLLHAVSFGLGHDRLRRKNQVRLSALREFKARFDQLTPREREVLSMVVEGRLNKQIAHTMGMAEKTVKVHRARMMQKLKAASLAQLCKMVDRLQSEGTKSSLTF